jgi:capsular exopolysaccharide synthesis family protein
LPVVAEQAAKTLNSKIGAGEILSSIVATPSAEADTATVTATTSSPTLSAEMANAYGEAYISFRRSADRSQVQDAIDLAESSLGKLTPEAREGTEGRALTKQLDQLKLVQALQTGGAELVQRASPPSSPTPLNTKRNVVFGIVLGALLGFGLAALLERIDRRVRSVEELEELYGLPILARIPRSRRLAGRREAGLGPQTQEGEAFRVLRTNLRYFDVDRDVHSILMVSPEEGDGKSTVTRGLAMTMAAMGDDIVLVEADLRKGGEFRQITGSPADGLSNVLAGTPLEKVLIKMDVSEESSGHSRELTVLPSGPVPPNPTELLESDRMKQVLAELQESFRFVILDSPALAAVGDALALVPEVSEVIVVGGLGKTTRDAARELSKQFALLGRRPIGVAANFTNPERAKYSHYYRPELAGSSTSRS